MKVLLISQMTGFFKNAGAFTDIVGMGYVSSFLKKNGHETKLLHQLNPKKLSNEDIIKICKEFGADMVGFSTMTDNFNANLKLAKQIKDETGCLTVFGGAHVTAFPDEVLRKEIDYVVRGEGENTMLELVNCIEKGKSVKDIKGLSYKEGETLRNNPPRERITDLDSLPFPDREGLPIEDYKCTFSVYPPISKQRLLSVSTSRGCVYNCSFCSTPKIWGRRWIARSPKSVVDEIEFLVNKYKINFLLLSDEDFLFDKKRAIEICKEIRKRKINVNWFCEGRVSSVDEELAAELVKAGCNTIGFGIESGDDTILKAVNKELNVTDVINAVKIVNKYDIASVGFFMIGFPYETKESIKNSKKLLSKLDLDIFGLNFVVPFKGTQLYEYAEKNGLLINNSTDDFTMNKLVMKTHELNENDLRRAHSELLRGFYFNKRYISRVLKKILNNPRFARGYIECLFYSLHKKLFL